VIKEFNAGNNNIDKLILSHVTGLKIGNSKASSDEMYDEIYKNRDLVMKAIKD
jgi:hypothetical protein